MKQFEQTKNNIQRILNAIKENECYSQKDISKIVGISQTSISYNIKRINNYDIVIYKDNEGKYITKEENVNNLQFIIKISKIIKELKENPTIYFWQNKYITMFFGLNTTEIGQFRAYAEEYLKELKIKY